MTTKTAKQIFVLTFMTFPTNSKICLFVNFFRDPEASYETWTFGMANTLNQRKKTKLLHLQNQKNKFTTF
jgi:hypothetical protein